MLYNLFSKILIGLVVLATAFVTLSFVERPAPSKAELSWPPRPVMVPAPRANDLSDYFLRHPDSMPEPVFASIPVTGAVDLSDFHQRLRLRDSTDHTFYYDDYFMRHPTLNATNHTVDTSDYFLRHRE